MPKFNLKARVAKLDDVAEPYRPAYVENDGEFSLDPVKLEAIEFDDTAELEGALEHERAERKKAVEAATALAEKYKDIDPEKYTQMMADIAQKDQDNKKKSGDWEGWESTFITEKEASDRKFKDEISTRDKRIQKFLLDDKNERSNCRPAFAAWCFV